MAEHPSREEQRKVFCDKCRVNPDWATDIEDLQKRDIGDEREKTVIRWIIGIFLGVITLAVFTYKSDLEDKNASFRNEIIARQKEHAQQMATLQDSAERANLARNAVFSVQIESISSKVGEMTTNTAIISRLFEQAQKREQEDRERTDQIVKKMEDQIARIKK